MTRPAAKCEAAPFAAFLRRSMRAMGRRAGEGDLDSLAALVELARDLDAVIAAAARAAHGDVPGAGPAVPASWTEIATAVGVSRQAARQRWGTEAAS